MSWTTTFRPTPLTPTGICGENTVQSPGIVVWGNSQTRLPDGTDGVPYAYGFGTAPGSDGTFTYGAGLPTGVTGDASGHLSGTPTTTGLHTFDVILTNAAGAHTISVELFINP